MRVESTRILAEKQGGIAECFDAVVSVQKSLHWSLEVHIFLAKQEIAHTTDFTPLVNLAKSLGATYLGEISLGQNMKYTSELFMQDIVLPLGKTVQEPVKEEMQASPMFSVLIDETTDVSILNQMKFMVILCIMKRLRLTFLVWLSFLMAEQSLSRMHFCSSVGKWSLTYTGSYLLLVAMVLV